MIIIPVSKDENIDKALKRFKRKFNQIGVMKEIREREQFTKPSVKRRKEVQKAKYIQKLKDAEEYNSSKLVDTKI